jgi:hypothetical protein
MNRAAIIIICVLLGTSFSFLAQSPQVSAPSDTTYEELPDLNASDIIKPELLKGPHFSVREPVSTSAGTNQFTIDSDYGLFEADGNEMLLRRINEIFAIGQLKDVSRTDQFKSALATAAKSPLVAAKTLVTDPVNTVTNVPKGIFKFMGRAGESVRNVGQKKEGKDPEGRKMEQLIGYSGAKRKIAVKLGVDPYSTNQVLQKELDGIAWASFAGGFTFQAATFPISGPAGVALTVTGVSNSLNQMVADKAPKDLQTINRQALTLMGSSENEINRFLNNNSFSPTAQTAFVLNLKSLEGVQDRRSFVRIAGEAASDESDAIFCVQTAALLAKVHNSEKPLARIALIADRFPIAVAKDGTIVVALQWDYAAWTPGAARFTEEVQKLDAQSGKKGILVAISGQASPRLKQELQARRIAINDRVNPGPLK